MLSERVRIDKRERGKTDLLGGPCLFAFLSMVSSLPLPTIAGRKEALHEGSRPWGESAEGVPGDSSLDVDLK